ncbi:hypothetical protein PV325_000357, partial [Microctonus aethiopoides]
MLRKITLVNVTRLIYDEATRRARIIPVQLADEWSGKNKRKLRWRKGNMSEYKEDFIGEVNSIRNILGIVIGFIAVREKVYEYRLFQVVLTHAEWKKSLRRSLITISKLIDGTRPQRRQVVVIVSSIITKWCSFCQEDWLGDHQRIKQPLGQLGILIQSGNHHGANEWKKDMWLPNYGVALYEVLTKKASKNTLKCDTE